MTSYRSCWGLLYTLSYLNLKLMFSHSVGNETETFIVFLITRAGYGDGRLRCRRRSSTSNSDCWGRTPEIILVYLQLRSKHRRQGLNGCQFSLLPAFRLISAPPDSLRVPVSFFLPLAAYLCATWEDVVEQQGHGLGREGEGRKKPPHKL